jgi:DNA-3-methyladenine glycosylase II
MKFNEYNCAVKHFLKNDVLISELMSKYGPIELKKRRNYFLHLTTSIIGQQLSVQSASSIIKRFKSYFGNQLVPRKIVNTKIETLRSLGLSNAKAKYVKDLAGKLLSKELQLNGISSKNDLEVMDELTKVKGIGPWTVHMFLIFVLGRKDVLPEGDLGIKKAIMLNYSIKNLPTGEEVLYISNKNNWAPYNSYASLFLWKSIDGN